MKALGVPELLSNLEGKISAEEARQHGQQATRHYVKRQTTWFRHQIISDYVLKTKYIERYQDKIFSEISKFVLTCSGA